MRLFMSFRQTETPTVTAAKAGFSAATAYRVEQDPRAPLTKESTAWPSTARSAGCGLDAALAAPLSTPAQNQIVAADSCISNGGLFTGNGNDLRCDDVAQAPGLGVREAKHARQISRLRGHALTVYFVEVRRANRAKSGVA
jgi:hypothetical protein